MIKLIVEPSPHIRSKNTSDRIMAKVLIALTPALAMSVYIFGPRALLMCAICVLSCTVFDVAYLRIFRKDTNFDLSPAVTGLLLAFNLPVTLPIYIAVIGCFVAIIPVKQLFGGLGQNFANPAITARIVLLLSFSVQMTHWVEPFYYRTANAADAITSATPLAIAAEGVNATETMPGLVDLILGFHGGSLGETSAFALLIGFVFLVCTRVIRSITPLAFIGTVAVGAFAMGADVGVQVFSGGLILGAVYMATDYPTTPISLTGKFVFGVGCGLITLAIRFFAEMPEGVSFAILIMNIVTFYIDKITIPRVFGAVAKPFKLPFLTRKGGNDER
ncbi:MAG: RnfABCDGE type electron transport complex subunit D [Oscillospiraceae bacterium]|nr:RnfABCDGE type electron transport complex subunit D [Oscillospiraceae bacterium]